MTILTTGGAGYIGSHIAYRLAELGQASVIVDDLSTGSRDAAPPGTPLIVGKIEDEDLMRQVIRDHGCGSGSTLSSGALFDVFVRAER